MNMENRNRAQPLKALTRATRGESGVVNALARFFHVLFSPVANKVKSSSDEIPFNPYQARHTANPEYREPERSYAPDPVIVQPIHQRKAAFPDILTRTLDALHCPVVVVGPRRLVAHVNAEARELFGHKIVGRNLALFFREPKALDMLTEVMNDGGTRRLEVNLDVPIQRQYMLVISRLSEVPSEPPHAVLEFQETTLIKRTESMRSEFVANVSHELRSPLATLIGFIETMQSASDDPSAIDINAQVRFLNIMEGEAQRMSRMIDDLLSLTNVELREHERPRDPVDLAELLREVVDALAARGHNHQVDITLECASDLPQVCGARDQLIQVFHNLIVNAIKYGSSGGCVDVTAVASENGLPDGGPSLQVSVRDYGDGIEAEHIPRLTERFYRIDKGRSRSMGGTGLGLAIVKHIVNRHRGRFQIESTLGKGSTFSVRLPAFTGRG
ncbi:ATP-binding protein [Magnetovibrio sp.]|uniref:ATP-binding protein n=1 Tax=Magnetovibrio sp. TaxID=2024836 RepID=UPI002F93004A